MQKVVLATGNPGKVTELASLLADFGLDIVAQTELGVGSVEETGLTFVENALIKARHAAKVTGLPAIADDSGISVDALGGAPGIYSSRYAGIEATDQQNVDKFHVIWQGVLTQEMQGDGGFGYDPIFFIPELNCTAAQLTREQKNQYSHRGKALKLMLDALKNA